MGGAHPCLETSLQPSSLGFPAPQKKLLLVFVLPPCLLGSDREWDQRRSSDAHGGPRCHLEGAGFQQVHSLLKRIHDGYKMI